MEKIEKLLLEILVHWTRERGLEDEDTFEYFGQDSMKFLKRSLIALKTMPRKEKKFLSEPQG